MEAQQSIDNIKIDSKGPLEQPETKYLENPQQEQQEPSASFLSLFRFATPLDICLMIFGSLAAIAMGVAMPSFALLWGNMTDSFGEGGEAMVTASLKVLIQFIYVGAGAFVASWMMFACWMITGQRQAIQCRKKYFQSLLKQEIGWFDTFNQAQMASKFATNSFAFQGAIGQKVATAIMTVSMVCSGFVIGFVKGWLMAIVTISILPALAIASFIYMFVLQKKDSTMQKHYAQAGGAAEQAISSIKTVKQLNGQEYQVAKYQELLNNSSRYICLFALFSGFGIGLIFFVMLSCYALGFWWGSVLIEKDYENPVSSNGYYNTGDTIVIFFCILIGGFNVAQLFPSIEKITKGKQAAGRIFSVIDRQPKIINSPNALKPNNIKGIIKFQNVTFAYPKDPSRKILNNLTIEFDCKTSALVGQSGSGKSTILQLIMRFYDPDQGNITLDGIDLRQLDLHWLRNNVGYVGQEPVLFAISIRQNLLFGKQNATQQEMIDALEKAQAYTFVQSLEKGLDTFVGHGGGQLSGGQKQRIAIARAILKNPKILLLDEATSALDRRNQKLIQETLNKISSDRTTISVAHRVKTIASSNIIYVLDQGKIIETGTFENLSRFKNMQFDEQQSSPLKHKASLLQENDKKQQKQLKKENKQNIPLTEEEKQQMEQKQLVEKYKWSTFCRLFSYSFDKIFLTIIGLLAAIINGTIFPFFAMLFGRLLAVLINLEVNPTPQDRSNANFYASMFVMLGGVAFFANLFQVLIFNYVGQSMTRKIRIQTYQKIMKMPVPWFDIARNNAGSLNARLATDCQQVNGLVTTFIAIIIQNISTLVTGLVIAFVYQWRISLVALGLMPLLIIAGVLEMAVQTGFSDQSDKAYKDSSNLIMESTVNIRTVCSFGNEKVFINQYSSMLQQPLYIGIKKGNIAGILYGFSQFCMFIVIGILFYVGSIFIRDFGVTISDLFSAIYAIIFSGLTAGNNFHFMPDAGEGFNAAANIFAILDGEDENQKQQKENSKFIKEKGEGKIQFKNINFKYESRKDWVFTNFNLSINQGEKVAFVGASGCGKSTLLQLILRFYDPIQGQITIGGIEIKDFDIHYLRSRFGIVSQQPALFNGSFADNIKYNTKDVTMQQIEQAAKEANAISFIIGDEQLVEKKKAKNKTKKKVDQGQDTKKIFEIDEDDIQEIGKDKTGFDRGVGIKGSHISGGQKQRVAIARAILRKPHILLLDEATSALDSMNQKKVQQSLDRIMKQKTSISIAHRIDTIKNSDKIYVFQKGKVVEEGKYDQLVRMKGYFFNLERGTEFI